MPTSYSCKYPYDSDRWLNFLPYWLVANLDVFGLIVIGFLVEKHYVSRPAIFANSIAINLHAWKMGNPPGWLTWYANRGVIIGVIAIFTYAAKEQPGSRYYTIAYFYSSMVVGGSYSNNDILSSDPSFIQLIK